MCICHRNTEQRVRTELALVWRTVERDQLFVQAALVKRIETLERIGNCGVDVGHGIFHTLAEITRLVAIAQLDRLA